MKLVLPCNKDPAALSLVAVHLSFGRAAVLLAWAQLGTVALWMLIAPLRRKPIAVRVNIVLVYLVVAGAATTVFIATADGKLLAELSTLRSVETFERAFHSRWWQTATAAEIWKDYPWFGAGGWGYRYLIGFYLEREHWHLLLPQGRANVHNDLMQFLAEFGAIGMGLLLATVATLGRHLARPSTVQRSVTFIPLLGLSVTVAHSMIDLPFRNPAILMTWLAVLTATARYAQLSRSADSSPSLGIEKNQPKA
jgi:hypothetical protein